MMIKARRAAGKQRVILWFNVSLSAGRFVERYDGPELMDIRVDQAALRSMGL
jgi:hypothetical protein